MIYFQAIIIILIPYACHELIKLFKVLNVLGAVILCYAFGILSGNVLGFEAKMAEEISSIAVPLSIPLLLLSTDFKKWIKYSRSTVLAFCFQIFAVMTVAILLGLFYRKETFEVQKIAAMLTGVYIGGTPNMSALKLALGAKNETFLWLNAADMFCSSFYFLWLIGPAQRVLLNWLPSYQKIGVVDEAELTYPWFKKAYKYIPLSLLYALTILAFSFFLAKILSSESMFVAVIIFIITTCAILGSFSQKLKENLHGAYDIGSYVLLVFCTAIGAQARPESLFAVKPSLVIMTFLCIILSSLVHILLCRLARIDADTAIVTNTAGIFGPAFIGPVAKALKNPEILVVGITTGLVGYALGNYAGLIVHAFLSLIY